MPVTRTSGKRPTYGRILPVRPRDYVLESFQNNPSRYKGEANKSAHPTDDEEFIPARQEMVNEHSQ